MRRYILDNALVATGKKVAKGAVAVSDGIIDKVIWEGPLPSEGYEIVDCKGMALFAGGIDAHVHFRDPGLTHKADIASESAAALLGGVTSFLDMPNTVPPTVSVEALKDKVAQARQHSKANYGFYIGASEDNIDLIERLVAEHPDCIAGVKLFMGSSTGGMLVQSEDVLERLFSLKGCTLLVHSEDENRIRRNLADREGREISFYEHPQIRDSRACILSTIKALDKAIAHGTALHVCHVSTREEVEMIAAAKLHNPRITCETSVNYLWFCDEDYARLGGRLKCNPAIKSPDDRQALLDGLKLGVIDSIGSDHAPHLLEEKNRPYRQCPSGIPSIAHQFPALLTLAGKHDIPLSRIASAFSEKPSEIFGIRDRGVIEAGKAADLVLVDLSGEYSVPAAAPYKCGWSPYEGETFTARVVRTIVSGPRYLYKPL